MYRYHYRLRVLLLSLGVVLGFGSGIAHLAGYRDHDHRGAHGCADRGWSWDDAPWQAQAEKPGDGKPAPKPVQ